MWFFGCSMQKGLIIFRLGAERGLRGGVKRRLGERGFTPLFQVISGGFPTPISNQKSDKIEVRKPQ
jgi:hypothetical protein